MANNNVTPLNSLQVESIQQLSDQLAAARRLVFSWCHAVARLLGYTDEADDLRFDEGDEFSFKAEYRTCDGDRLYFPYTDLLRTPEDVVGQILRERQEKQRKDAEACKAQSKEVRRRQYEILKKEFEPQGE